MRSAAEDEGEVQASISPDDMDAPAKPVADKKPNVRRTLRVSRSRQMGFDRPPQILDLLYKHRDDGRILRAQLIEESGLPES